MRILHILDHGLPLHSGYSFRTRAILKAQAAAGLEVAALTGVRHGAELPDAWNALEEEVEGFRFFRTPAVRPAPSPLAELREVDALARRLAEVVEAWRPDVLHAHSPVLDALAAQRVATRFGLPMVYEIRAFWEDAAVANGTGAQGSPRYRATRWLETRACRKADAVAVICEGLRADLVERGIEPTKILVSPNGVDLTLFGAPGTRDDALAAELGLPDDAEVVGFIGSFYDYEGVDDLIAAMPALVAERPSAHLLLVGGGPMDEALKAQAAASPVADRIRFVGRVPHERVERYYGLVDILAYPRKAMRLTELVTPLKPLEAMAQRRLVAASDVGGHRELIEHDVTGTLFTPDDPDAVAAALARLFASRDDWDGYRAAGRAFVERERDWATNVSRYARLYRTLLRPATVAPTPTAPASAMSAESQRRARIRMADKAWLRRLSAAPLEAPLGLVVGASLAFALAAMPQPLCERLVAATGLPALTAAADAPVAPGLGIGVIGVLALLAGLVTWAALMLAGGRKPWTRRIHMPGAPRVRRADAHPDAPPRAPILAARDLGPPMMDVAVAASPRLARAAPAEPAAAATIAPAPMPAAVPEAVAIQEPRHPPEAEAPIADDDVLDLTDIYDPDVTLPPAADVAPPPAIHALIERLKAGIERRSAAGVTATPFDGADPVLREALASLDRLAAGRC